jgi:hypothetical protein
MPFTDNVSSISGRNSRASNVSAATGASRSMRSPPAPIGAHGDTLANAGVLSMLKTSTDTGDIGALSFNSSHLPRMPGRAGQRRQHPSRMSGSSHPHQHHGGPASHSYAPSVTSRVSSNNAREWDTASHGRRGSMTSMQTMPTFMSDTQATMMSGAGRPLGPGPPLPGPDKRDSRSYSLTNAVHSSQLPRHRSANSLKSQGHEPRYYTGPPPPMPENRGPFVYPTRLKRPGYRSPSPALSDTYSQGHAQMPLQPPLASRRHHVPPVPPMPTVQPAMRPPMPPYISDYGVEYPPDPGYLNVPPPRGMTGSPVNYEQPPPPQSHFGYRSGPMRTAPAMPMQHHGQRPMPPQPHSIYGPARPMYATAPYPVPQHARRGPPPNPNVGPVAHHIFHNAARMVRQVPQRTDTPMTDSGPPSSDPPSSGTMPTASGPPTPRDDSTIQVIVDPAFIDPALTDLPESTSDPVIPAKYFEYADGLERALDDSEIEVHRPSVPPSGFVQRVRAMLESRAAAEAAVKEETDREHERIAISQVDVYNPVRQDMSRFTVIEEFQSPVELPASPIKIAELPASPIKSARRLTRDMIKAELAPSTTEVLGDSQLETETPRKHTPSPMKPKHGTPGTEVTDWEPSHVDTSAEETDIPSSPPEIGHKGSVTESIATHGSIIQSKASGMDFALQFRPHDPPQELTETTATDLGETETESCDPFALDADTITAQHRDAKDSVLRSLQTDLPKEPVSPLLAGEDVSRFSAVSPIQTETLGIDATLHMAPRDESQFARASLKPIMPGSFVDDAQPPPTPRTPRTYSKSVHLPQASVTLTEATNTNRLSLPADLSQIGDTTMNSTTDAMTDVAVRFSMPQTTITMGRPQIVSISSSSTPPKEEMAPLKPAIHSTDQPRRRGSVVTFEDEVAPLKVNKKAEQHRQSQSLGAIAPRNRSSQVSRGPSPFEEQQDTERSSRDGTADFRFSGINFIRNKYPSTHLPGLKEESSEDMSVTDHRRSCDIANGLHFQLPARIAAVKAMQERRQQELEQKKRLSDPTRQLHPDAGRPLGDTKDLPSLNFSRTDLIDKLNNALQIRPSKSMEVVRRRDLSAICCPSPQRPQSTEPLWDRYASFFNKPEDFPVDDDEVSELSDEVVEIISEGQQSRRESKAISEADSDGRPLSPQEHMLQVATQVNRLSIPSVNGLSERLSELLPSLRNLHLDSVLANDREVAHTIDDIHQLGHIPGPRPDTVLSTRTSAGFRTLAERAEDIVLNGTHDSIVPYKALSLNKELPPLPASMSVDKWSAVTPGDGKASYLSGSISAPSGISTDIQRPASAVVRTKSPITQAEVYQLLPPESNPIARGSRRSLLVSSLSSRPWNLDENYPWSASSLAFDLTVPEQAHHKETLASEVARQRGTKSLDLTPSGDLLSATISGIDIGSITTELDPTATLTTGQLTGVSSTVHTRRHSKRSIIGSIKHKMGLSCLTAEDSTKTLTTSSPAVRNLDDLTHNPGDRYPTTALTPPVGFNLDEVRSYFSDDSSDGNKDHRKTPKGGRRWTGLKSRNRQHNDPSRTQSIDDQTLQTQSYDAGSLNEQHLIAGDSLAYTLDGVGMGKAEFRIKRFGEKLRILFAKSGELIRSLSTRSKQKKAAAERDDWLSDSLYSGV